MKRKIEELEDSLMNKKMRVQQINRNILLITKSISFQEKKLDHFVSNYRTLYFMEYYLERILKRLEKEKLEVKSKMFKNILYLTILKNSRNIKFYFI